MKIEGRTFVISGGASGLGKACVLDICSTGGYAAVLDFNKDAGAELVQEIGPSVKFFQTNVTDSDSIAAAVKGTLEWVREIGILVIKPLGGVIAAAGVGGAVKILDRNHNPFDLSTFDHIMSVNVRGTIDLLRQFLPHLSHTVPAGPDGERGVLVLVSSSAAFDGQPGQVSYSASKGAIASLTLPLTRDLAPHGIRAVTIAPSLFESNMTARMSEKVKKGLERVMEFPVRAGKGEEFAMLVRQCIENVMLNGVVLRLDGGMRMASKI